MTAPAALLLDFGGVLVETSGVPDGSRTVANRIRTELDGDAPELSISRINDDIVGGLAAWEAWKTAQSHDPSPNDISYETFWGDFIATGWPASARRYAVANAEALCRDLSYAMSERWPRSGIDELLRVVTTEGVRVGIVSNALSGAVHRELVDQYGFANLISVQIYSDEVGIRKPNPEMIWKATRELGVAPADAWYVGDQHDRDVECGHRAGVGKVVLMVANRTGHAMLPQAAGPDLVVKDPNELLAALRPVLATRSPE